MAYVMTPEYIRAMGFVDAQQVVGLWEAMRSRRLDSRKKRGHRRKRGSKSFWVK